ncbi:MULTISPECIES: DNA ligase [unclassified Paenibacillus]|uniref:DNA ligase n=1 Tax=unclassified Paenibacillus TaxID=185978 RepID=UPI002405CC28|nr:MULTISPECIES: DNA ligase [unclassified Paenibacillus]MDF9841405.1 hypothetical protein [Paenibacillus sp. PastF-2]MDF9847996.1 hypothetical protein [Paenibacillus sp. PastM-2]MDF9854564.1 hypothetical protein [Paenibacillus sp. PastF-1]MDH6479827.1 hypothetical protein [Paenibacillus sp. PastH-2]MDH6507271.1 hypothetical protein [Paenibacillus sp. PastM-3]
MNIGSLFRGLLGDSRPGEAKSLELKEGQVVRGVVLSVSESGKEAVVQIQGTPVRAELETPLAPGQSLTLQVEPPGEGGLPVLKPLTPGEAALVSPQSMGEALESLGLKDAKAGKEIVIAMQSGGLPLTKETAAKLDAIMNAKPQGVPASEWLEAAVLSVKRGLPVTAESVKGLQQAVFGPKLHELLSKLETELGVWAQQAGDAESGKAGGPALNKGAGAPAVDHTAGTVAAGNAAAEPEETAGTSKTAASPAGAESGSRTVSAGTQMPGTAAADHAARAMAGTAGGMAVEDNPGQMAVEDNAGGTTAENEAGEPAAAKGAAGKELPASGPSAAGTPGNPAARAGAEAVGAAVNPQSADAGETAGATGVPVKSGATETAGLQSAAAKAGNTAPAGTAGNTGTAEPQPAAGEEPADVAAKGGTAMKSADGQPAPSGAAAAGGALLTKLQGVLTELRGTLSQLTDQAGAAAQPEEGAPPAAAAGQEPARAAGTPRGDSPAAAQQPGQAPAPAQDTESWVGRVLKLLGAEHEQQAVRGGAAAAQAASGGGAEAAADTLKGVLLQVMGSGDAPPAVKDAAGQIVAQLTGQQLLLNTDRTAPFAQVTLFLPLRGPDGEETASVHIQSRRGRKGELDAANCRLWFDLDMKQLGQTLVDVQVVDRIVSLKLHNNDPWVLELLEGRREEMAAAAESIGYQLSSLRTEPLPEMKAASGSAAVAAKLAEYTPDSYKGVDYRI